MSARIILRPTTGQAADLPGVERVAAQRHGARLALAAGCRLAGVELGPLEHDERDAPVPFAGVHWSLTHTRAWVAAALDTRPIGVDVEALRLPRGPRESALDDTERDLFGDAPLELAFARCWTAKESVLKLLGVGLLELGRCQLVDLGPEGTCLVEHRGTTRRVQQRSLGDHVLAVCASGALEWHGLPAHAHTFSEVSA